MIDVPKPVTMLEYLSGKKKITAKRIDFLKGNQDTLWKASDQKATKAELTQAREDMEGQIADKADASDIASLNESLAGKASQAEVDTLASSVASKASQADFDTLSDEVDSLDISKLIDEEAAFPSDGLPGKIISVASKLYVYKGVADPATISVSGADYSTGGNLYTTGIYGLVFHVIKQIAGIAFSVFSLAADKTFTFAIYQDSEIIYTASILTIIGENKIYVSEIFSPGEYEVKNVGSVVSPGLIRHNTSMPFVAYPHTSEAISIVKCTHLSYPYTTYYWFYNWEYEEMAGEWVKIYDSDIDDTDIPALPQSKITNLTTVLAAKASNTALSTAVADLSSDIAEKASNDDLDDTNANVTALQTSKASVSALARTTNMDIYSNANLQSFIIGPTYSTATAFCTELGLFLEVRTPVWLSQTKLYMKDADNVLVQIYNYENDVVIYEESFSLVANENIISLGVLLPAGRYYFSGTSDNESLAYFPSTEYSITHHFVSVFGGELDPVAFPDFMPGTTNQWAGFYQMTFKVPFKALYLGFLPAKEPNANLITGAFYHVNESGSLLTWCYDGTTQISN